MNEGCTFMCTYIQYMVHALAPLDGLIHSYRFLGRAKSIECSCMPCGLPGFNSIHIRPARHSGRSCCAVLRAGSVAAQLFCNLENIILAVCSGCKQVASHAGLIQQLLHALCLQPQPRLSASGCCRVMMLLP